MKNQPKKDRIQKLLSYAGARYGRAVIDREMGILDRLVLGLLARRSSYSRAARYLESMHKEFVDWNEVRISTVTQIVSSIGRGDWSLEAAREIRELLDAIYTDRHEVSIEFLKELTPTQTRSCLMKLPHTDRPLADEVMLFALEIPTLPYGESQARMGRRLGLASDERVTVSSQRRLERQFEPDKLPLIHLLFSELKDSVCLPDFGKCEDCPLIDYCPSASAKPKRKRKAPPAKARAKRVKVKAKPKARKKG